MSTAEPSRKFHLIVSFLGWQAAWFACVAGAGAGSPAIGSLGAVVLIFASLAIRKALRTELLPVIAAGFAGYLVDSGLVLLGLLEFPDASRFGGPSTLWMALLWSNLTAHIGPRSAFGWLVDRPWLAAFIGATSGPLAYFGGMKLGAITLVDPIGNVLAVLAVVWGVGFPGLYALRHLFRRGKDDLVREIS